MIDQTAWRRDQDFRIARQQLHLFRIRHAAQDRNRLDALHVDAVLVGCSSNLQREFARRGQYQHFRLCRLEARTLAAATRRLAFLVRCLATVDLQLCRGELVE